MQVTETAESVSESRVLSHYLTQWTATFCIPATFTSNPQFVVRLEDVDDDPLDGQDGCTFLVGLMQKDGRRQKRLDRNLETIGFAIYEVSRDHFDISCETHMF